MRIETESVIVTCEDDIQQEVFEKLLNWYKQYECFSGEVIMQSDDPQLTAPVLLSDLADDIFKFKIQEWKDI